MTYKNVPAAVAPEIDLGASFALTRLDAVVNWGRRNSLWPFPFGTACCAIEFMGVVSSVFDVSRFGAELDGIFWGRGGESSALAPSYNGEAYWNYGPLGLFIVSLVLGLELAWLAHHAHLARLGRDTAYYMICLPAILLAVYMETWVAASYVGGFITLVLIYYIAKRFLPSGEDR